MTSVTEVEEAIKDMNCAIAVALLRKQGLIFAGVMPADIRSLSVDQIYDWCLGQVEQLPIGVRGWIHRIWLWIKSINKEMTEDQRVYKTFSLSFALITAVATLVILFLTAVAVWLAAMSFWLLVQDFLREPEPSQDFTKPTPELLIPL
jgi:hypothetical protein